MSVRVVTVYALATFLMVVEGRHYSRQNSSECQEELGDFSNLPSYNNTGAQDPDIINTTFRLFTETCTNKRDRVLRAGDMCALSDCGLDPALPIKIIVHGYGSNGRIQWIRDMISALQQKEQMTVISVDWENGAGSYEHAVANTRVVGAEIARLINFLRARQNVTVDNVHIIGHSLGAHIAGYAGQQVPGIARITGLEPAEPDFKDTDNAMHLDSSDANFVDIIHTDGSEYNHFSGYGWKAQLGHVDFYPNGGEYQPGCILIGCSHSRAYDMFTESINSMCHFYGHPCDSLTALDSNRDNCLRCPGGKCPEMGYWVDKNARGKFYLRTMEDTPYCGHTLHVKTEFGDIKSTEGQVSVEIVGKDQSKYTAIINSDTTAFISGGQYDSLIVDRETITEFIEVRVTFEQASESWGSWASSLASSWARWWWYGGSSNNTTSQFITVSKVTVTAAKDGRSIHFCVDDQVVNNGNTISLTRSSTDPNDC